MRRAYLLVMTLAILLTGCKSDSGMDDMDMSSMDQAAMQPIEVEIQVSPDQPKSGETVSFQAKITQDGSYVASVKEVKFEFWKEGQMAGHEMLKVAKRGDGIFGIDKAFKDEGTYHIKVHVTAAGMHTMPQQTFAIISR